MKKVKPITVILCLCILAMVGANKKLAAQDGCPPATCPYGSHSVCHKECDPNVSPICSPKCVCSCVPDGNSLQMNQNKDVGEPAAAPMGQAPPRQATLAQQKACSDQARAKFHEDGYDSLTPPGSYTSHYDAQSNGCYIMVLTVTHGHKDSLLGNRIVYDAFEGHVYGSMTIVMFRGSLEKLEDPSHCHVDPPNQPRIQCSIQSDEEFESLVKKYFGVEP